MVIASSSSTDSGGGLVSDSIPGGIIRTTVTVTVIQITTVITRTVTMMDTVPTIRALMTTKAGTKMVTMTNLDTNPETKTDTAISSRRTPPLPPRKTVLPRKGFTRSDPRRPRARNAARHRAIPNQAWPWHQRGVNDGNAQHNGIAAIRQSLIRRNAMDGDRIKRPVTVCVPVTVAEGNVAD